MKWLSLAIVMLALAGCAGLAPSYSGGAWEQQIRATEERHRIAFLANDAGTLDALFSDDFIVNSPQNRIIEKVQLLGMVRGGVLAISSFDQNRKHPPVRRCRHRDGRRSRGLCGTLSQCRPDSPATLYGHLAASR